MLNSENYTFLNVSNITIGNVTLTATWSVMSAFSLLICICGAIGNGTLLFLFVKDHTLRTPFNIYLINLLIANMSCIVIQYQIDIIINLYSFTWFMGESACTLYLYACTILEGIIPNAHQLIAINRIWAVVHPISYRSHHSVRTATILCVGMSVFVHLVVGPILLADTLYYRLPIETNGCLFNAVAQPVSNVASSLLIFDWPEVLILLAFPIIYFTRKLRQKAAKRANIVAPSNMSSVTHFREQCTGLSNERSRIKEKTMNVDICDALTASGSNNARASDPVPTQAVKRVHLMAGSQKKKSKSHGNLVLGLLALSVTICWTPDTVYYIIITFIDMDAPIYYQVATILFSCQTMLDPILFMVALKSLRQSFRRTFSH
jgi:7 transmembrane receptor (rhodopsin family)